MIVLDPERVAPWVCKRAGGKHYPGSCTAIGWEKGGELVAGVLYDQFNGQSVCMHVAAEGRRWLTREYLNFCFSYPFDQLKVKKLIGLVDSNNANALRFDRHLGFVEEARLADAGNTGDLIILTMTRQQCRWL